MSHTFAGRIGQQAKNSLDKVGKQYGKWLVIERDGSNGHDSSWLCRNVVTLETKTMLLTTLVSHAKRFAASRNRNMISEHFGDWIVVDVAPPDGITERWICVSRQTNETKPLTLRSLQAFEREAIRRAKR